MSSLKDMLYKTFVYDDRYLFFLEGLKFTLIIAFFSVLLGLFLGILTSVIRDYYKETGKYKFLNDLCNIYVYVIRGTPTILQLMILYYVVFKSATLSPIIVGTIAFGINSGAYVSEIFRAGFEGIDKGQREASKTLGLNYIKTMRYVIFPQALAKIFPALGNEVITLVKDTSLANVVAYAEITLKAKQQMQNYSSLMPLFIAGAFYFVLAMILTVIASLVEKKLNYYK
jgi:His/Glu/Gln/Arg/opine family amino acid ABC transporter permease subunit